MWIIWVLVLGIIAYVAWRAVSTKGFACSQHESAIDILKKRYAKGEITKDDYERLKKELE